MGRISILWICHNSTSGGPNHTDRNPRDMERFG